MSHYSNLVITNTRYYYYRIIIFLPDIIISHILTKKGTQNICGGVITLDWSIIDVDCLPEVRRRIFVDHSDLYCYTDNKIMLISDHWTLTFGAKSKAYIEITLVIKFLFPFWWFGIVFVLVLISRTLKKLLRSFR